MQFPEELLHYAWRFRKFSSHDMLTDTGESISILYPGTYNTNSGPDFSAAQINIGGTIWAGCVELHLKSSDWLQHGHQHDHAYDNVILHVVYESDAVIIRSDGSQIPEFALQGRLDPALFEKFERLVTSGNYFPCMPQIVNIAPMVYATQLNRTCLERLEHRTSEIFRVLQSVNGDWNQTCYHWLLKSFGFRVNSIPLEMLALAMPFQILARHQEALPQMEALLFGQAGFLANRMPDAYGRNLRSEYQFLKRKYGLSAMPLAAWKFMRMRPANFPTLRIAQFAAFFYYNPKFMSVVLESENLPAYRQLFANASVSSYWTNHYHFRTAGATHSTHIGADSIDTLLINAIVPLLFAYGKYMDQQQYIEKGLGLLEALPAEQNAITKTYRKSGMLLANALESQGVLELKKNYCDQKHCLRCGIGISLLR